MESISGSNAETIGKLNPMRYRGYYQDTETGFYSLQSRYYDPEIGRFINADEPEVLFLTGGDLLGTNLFSYANNNPVMNYDPAGYFSIPTIIAGAVIGGFFGAAIEIALQIALGKTFSNLDWGFIGIEFVCGAITGAIIGCGLPAKSDSIARGVIGLLASLSHSIKNGKFKTLRGAAASIGTAVLSGAFTAAFGIAKAKYGAKIIEKIAGRFGIAVTNKAGRKLTEPQIIAQVITKVSINRLIRGGIRFGVGWGWFKFSIVLN